MEMRETLCVIAPPARFQNGRLESRTNYFSRAIVSHSQRSFLKIWDAIFSCSPTEGSFPCLVHFTLPHNSDFIISYGLSTGSPTEKGLLIDAQTALDYLLNRPAAKAEKIFIYGQSLGGALAIQLTSRNQGKIAGLVLENTFLSMRTLIPSAFPPAKYLAKFCHQIWPSEKTLPQIQGIPTLFLSGAKDELVP